MAARGLRLARGGAGAVSAHAADNFVGLTLGKTDTLANKRLAFARLRDREMVLKLFAELGPRYANRNGGYLRILKMGFRVGDNAPMAYVELMDRPEVTDIDAAPTAEE